MVSKSLQPIACVYATYTFEILKREEVLYFRIIKHPLQHFVYLYIVYTQRAESKVSYLYTPQHFVHLSANLPCIFNITDRHGMNVYAVSAQIKI